MARSPDDEVPAQTPRRDQVTHHDPHPHDQVRDQDNPLTGLKPVPCQCWPCRWHRTADKAIALNGAVRLEGTRSVMVVADVVIAEAAANGIETPETYRLVRDDGRCVYVFVDDPEAAA